MLKKFRPASRRRTYGRIVAAIAFSALIFTQLPTRFDSPVHAAGGVSLTTIGIAYTQSFNSLANTPTGTDLSWVDDSTVPSWFASRDTYRVSTGTDNAGGLYSFGAASPATDRALGSVGSNGTGDMFYAVKLVNNTGTIINRLNISYTGEQWRVSNNSPQELEFQYQIANAGIIADANVPSSGWTTLSALNFTAPVTSGSSALDGNLPANRTAKTAFLTVSVAIGQEIWFRWRDANDSGNDDGLAIDDVSVTPLGGPISANGVRTSDIQGSDDGGFALALQPDARIVAGGYAVDPVNGDKEFAVARYNYSGTLDTTFGTGGKVVTDFGGTSDRIWGITLQADGKIVAVGETFNALNSTNDFAIARYNTDGSPDTTFGGTGRITTDYLAGNNNAYAVAMSGSNIIVVGSATIGGNNDFIVARYTSLGALDATFNAPGILPGTNTLGFSGYNDVARAVVIQSADSKIVVGGYSNNGTDDDFALARFNADGTIDNTTFGANGVITTDIVSGSADQAFGIALDSMSPQNILLVGSAYNNTTGNKDFALVRYLSNGALDVGNFGGNGIRTTDFAHSPDIAQAVTIQSDGKIVVGGFSRYSASSDDFAVARYNTDGTLDTTFDTDGKLTTVISNADERIYGVAQEYDGKIVAAGFAAVPGVNPVTRDFAIARYNPDGSLDAAESVPANLPDIAVTIEDCPPSVVVGDEYSYTVRVTNHGGVDATNVVLTDTLTAGIVYLGETHTKGTVGFDGTMITNDIGTLGAGDSATLTINVDTLVMNVITNMATATLAEADMTPANHTARAATRIVGITDMSFSPSTVIGGCQNSTGTVTLSYPAPAGGVTITLSTADLAANPGSSVFVPGGSKSATFTVVTSPVLLTRSARMEATLGISTFVRRLVLMPGVCGG